jgi:hypothetical protein
MAITKWAIRLRKIGARQASAIKKIEMRGYSL